MKWARIAIIVLIGWYLLLAVSHYLNPRPLWNDEQCILNNIIQLQPHDLFSRPLVQQQAFPRFYLFLIQQFSNPFHHTNASLRFLPFLCMMLAFGLWVSRAAKELQGNTSLVLYLLCWAASVRLIYYVSELKQYSMDVLLSALCLWALLEGFSFWWYLLPFGCLLSYPSIFWVPLFAWNLFAQSKSNGQWKPFFTYLLMVIIACGLFYYFDVRVSDHSNLKIYWHDYFINFDSWRVFFDSLGKSINNLIGRWFSEKPLWVRAGARFFVGIGFVYMLMSFAPRFKKEGFVFKSAASAAFGLFAIHLLFGILHVYPFVCPRTSLFIAPLLLLMTVMSMEWIKQQNKIIGQIYQGIFAIFLILVSLGIARIIFTSHLGADAALWQ